MDFLTVKTSRGRWAPTWGRRGPSWGHRGRFLQFSYFPTGAGHPSKNSSLFRFFGKPDTLIWALDRKSFHFWLLPKIQSAPTLLGCNPTFCKEFEIALLLWSTGGSGGVGDAKMHVFSSKSPLFFSTAETLKYRKVSQSMWLLRWWLRKLHHGWHAAISQFFNGRREECAEIDENCS